MNKNQIIGWIIIAAALAIFLTLYIQGYRITKTNMGMAVKDIEGFQYQTIRIGGQVWMAENMKSTRSAEGIPIKSFFPNNNKSNVPKYGRLYDWKTSMTLCPHGWHLPSDNDWIILTNYLGHYSAARLKDSTNWKSQSKITNNESHFTAIPAGYCDDKGAENYFGTRAIFWSSTAVDSSLVWCRVLINNADTTHRAPQHAHYAFSVRCVKN